MQTNTNFLFFLVRLSFFLNSIHVLCGQTDSLIVGCGLAEVRMDIYGRNWETDSKYINAKKTIIGRAAPQDRSLQPEVPYLSARIFTTEATYQFKVKSDGRYWLRIHFNPAVYGQFDTADSYFTVSANGVNLLKNFSASITSKALSQSTFFNEYSLAPLHSDSLRVVFKPAAGSFAFVNGIEVIPIPPTFYTAKIVGSSQKIDLRNSNLMTKYRLNVGGEFLSPTKDSGQTRTWMDDSPYLPGAAQGRVNFHFPNDEIDYKGMPESVAPRDVYSTSRSMGGYDLNLSFNLSWGFIVDPDSTYLCRLHFADYINRFPNQVVFKIFINNKIAEPNADVIAWSGGNAVPTYRDYVVHFSEVSGDQKLWVALHPSPEAKPEYLDALLNGLELFKMSDGGDLAGLNPQPSDVLHDAEDVANPSYDKLKYKTVIFGVVGGSIIVFIAVCVFFFGRKESGTLKISESLCRQFSLAEIKRATDGFHESHVIGNGGFGKVYKGEINGGIKVAIKRSNPSLGQGLTEFKTEIQLLSTLRHRNLVSLIGFCEEAGELCLVYDYMAFGTLRQHLYETDQPLSWIQRLEVCIGTAKGVHYLHTGAGCIIHRDLKTTNILLDENCVAKVSDFGLSKKVPDLTNIAVTTAVKGSFGYLDPEYFERHKLTEKSDVYSYGVILFEVLCGRAALNNELGEEEANLANWALKCKNEEKIEQIIDRGIKDSIHPQCLKIFTDLATKCLSRVGHKRPSMGDVLSNLEYILKLQKQHNASSLALFLQIDNPKDEEGIIPDEVKYESTDTDIALFLQIENPEDDEGIIPS